MLKALSLRGDTPLLVIGLSHDNVRQLKKNRPIVFDLAEISPLESLPICIAYTRPDGSAGLPRGFRGRVFAFTDQTLERMLRGECREYDVEIKVVVFVDRDEMAMEERLRRFITDQTIVRREGFPPSEVPPMMN